MIKGQDHERNMQEALRLAGKAEKEEEVPIGAVVVDQAGMIIGVGYNKVEQSKTQTVHAEMIALTAAALKKGDWRLENCLLYVTLEPCLMCYAAARLSRIEGIIYGATSNLFGCHLDRDSFVSLYNKNGPFMRSGVCEKESIALLRCFFENKRQKKGIRVSESKMKNVEAIKGSLMERKKELEEAIAQLQQGDNDEYQVQDPGDQANSAALESLKSSLHNTEYVELKMIEKALQMIDAGTYGICVDCGQPISEKRLKSYPNATRCIACQEKAEENINKGEGTSFF